jgi:pyridoxine 5'-phosphate synthase PdxJ
MKTIAEIEENPIEFVHWAREQIAAEHGFDVARMHESYKKGEAELKARGFKFVDFSQSSTAHESSVVREEPPTKE